MDRPPFLPARRAPIPARPATRRVLGGLRAIGPLLASCALACQAGSCGPRAMPQPQLVGSAPSVASSTTAPAGASFDLASVRPLLEAPALEGVRRGLDARDPRAAATALRAAIDEKKVPQEELDRASFLLGRLSVQAKDDDAADAAYAAVSIRSPLLPHATLRRAQIAARKGRADEALAFVASVPDEAPFATDRHFVRGDAQAAKGAHAEAAAEYALERKGPRANEATIRAAEELAAATAPEPEALAEAAKAVRKLRFEIPTSSLAARAEEAERRCLALAPAGKAPDPPSAFELATAARAALDAGKPKEAIGFAAKAVALDKRGGEAWCRASLASAKALDRQRERTKASDTFGEVASACAEEAIKVVALYDGAKAAISAKQPDLGRQRFAALEAAFPKHRLADDARLRGALAAIDAGELARGEAMLSSLPDDYPEGDMKTEALFRVALGRMKRGDWAQAIAPLERILTLAPDETDYFVAGRALYFLGRAKIETGAVDDGRDKLRQVITKAPLSFAAAMAYARLATRKEEEPALRGLLEGAIAKEPSGELFEVDRPETKSAPFARGIELARVGEGDLARREFAAAGLAKEGDRAAAWLVAAILSRAGDLRGAHVYPRHRIDEWNRHFPGGKWRSAWEIAFPRPYRALVEAASATTKVPATILWAIMREESAFDPDAVSPSAAYGLLQLIVPTATRYGKPLDLPTDSQSLLRPDVNVPIAAAYLEKLRADFPDNPALAVPSYNAGEGATRRWMNPPLAESFDLWVESIPYEETRKYTKRVISTYFAYVALYEPARLDAELRAAAGK